MKTFTTIHAVATNGKGKYLMLQRGPKRSNPGSWNVITGYVQERESAEEAALRELKEETNLEGKIIKTTEPFWRDDGEIRWIMVSSLIKVENIGDLKIDSYESSDYKWVKPDDPLVKTLKGATLSFKKLGIFK